MRNIVRRKAVISWIIAIIFLFVGTAFYNGEPAETKSDSLGLSNLSTPDDKNIPITGDINQLSYFFNALKDAKNKSARIAHFGDSIIEGDLVSADLREFLQRKYGGNGVGFVSMNAFDIQFRRSIRQTFSNDWKSAALFTKNPDKLPLGFNGGAYVPVENSWVKFESSNYSKWLKSFKAARVIYTNAGNNSTIKYSFNNGPQQTMKLQPGNKVKEAVISSNSDAQSLQINFFSCSSTVFYGVCLENGSGVYVDNFPLRGNSGGSIVDIPMNVLQDFNSLLNYKLIILQFGLNVLTQELSDYAWYVNKMDKVISYLKQAFPNTSILLISVGDKGVKQGSRYVTDPGVAMLRKAQKSIADKNHIAFWDMYEVMGGKNSMNDWVGATPPLAFKDYSHFTYEGATKVAGFLSEALMKEFK